MILAGGRGTRLLPRTLLTNKHLLAVHDRAMICYPLQQLVNAGLTDIAIVTDRDSIADFVELLGNGRSHGATGIEYVEQRAPAGVAAALALAEPFATGDAVTVMLGDNVFERAVRLRPPAARGARIYVAETDEPARFAVLEFEDARPARVVEKPSASVSRLAVTGCYVFGPEVFDVIRTLKPSLRGELEIADVIGHYLERGTLEYEAIDGWWLDAGTPDSLARASSFVAAARSGST